MSGEKLNHGTPFRRAMEDGCLDGHRVIQIGIRETCESLDDYIWAKKQVNGGVLHRNNLEKADPLEIERTNNIRKQKTRFY